MGLYIVANADGNVISSVNGINWTAPFNTGLSIGKVAIGPNKIVYAAGGEGSYTGLYYASTWNQTPILAQGTSQYSYNEVHYLGGKFVAVGSMTALPPTPAFAYSDDGINWTIGDVDPVYIDLVGTGNAMQFTDVGYNGTGYFITSTVSGEGLAGGFYVTDLSQELNETNWVDPSNFPVDAKQLVYSETPEGGESGFTGWSAFSDDEKTWFQTSNSDPSQPWNFFGSGGEGWDLTQIFFEQTGLDNPNIAEATIGILEGYVTWMLSTTSGQIIWWPHIPAGPFVSVPNPYTAVVSSVTNLNPLEINISGDNLPINNEKITIYGATDSTPGASPGFENLDGSYFVESLGLGNYRLYTDSDLESPVDASSWIGSYNEGSGSAFMSRGAYIDALGYGDGKFFAGNDDEEVFVCSSFNTNEENLVWTKVDDQNNSFAFWNDVSYGDFGSASYTYEFSNESPETMPNYRYGGEGNLDTTVYENESGQRVSRQRTGYFEIVNSSGGRKVVDVYDGETVDDDPEVPTVPANPTGNANATESGSTI